MACAPVHGGRPPLKHKVFAVKSSGLGSPLVRRVGSGTSSSSPGIGIWDAGRVSRRACIRADRPWNSGILGEADCNAARVLATAPATAPIAATPSSIGAWPAARRRLT